MEKQGFKSKKKICKNFFESFIENQNDFQTDSEML